MSQVSFVTASKTREGPATPVGVGEFHVLAPTIQYLYPNVHAWTGQCSSELDKNRYHYDSITS